jgi:hypothetical protein
VRREGGGRGEMGREEEGVIKGEEERVRREGGGRGEKDGGGRSENEGRRKGR